MKHLFSTLLLAVILTCGCQETPTETRNTSSRDVAQVATEYFATFAERADWEKLLSFYSPDLQFEDIVLQMKLESFEDFKEFYDWPNPDFEKLSPDQQHLVVETLATYGNRVAVARGHLNPFMWQGELVDPPTGLEFTIWLYFDENLKIIRQIDWMEYDHGVLESVIKRVREEGVD